MNKVGVAVTGVVTAGGAVVGFGITRGAENLINHDTSSQDLSIIADCQDGLIPIVKDDKCDGFEVTRTTNNSGKAIVNWGLTESNVRKGESHNSNHSHLKELVGALSVGGALGLTALHLESDKSRKPSPQVVDTITAA